MALGKLGKEMADAFGDYFLKSRKAVEESDTGRTQPKPAAKYIKEMQRQGVSDEEMKDLGLTEFDPKGPRAQEKFTKQEMLDLIDQRREERGLVSEGFGRSEIVGQRVAFKAMEKANPAIKRDGGTGYDKYVANIGGDDQSVLNDYEEIIYTSGRGNEREVSGSMMRDEQIHFPQKRQLFHLRLNQSQTPEGEGVTNLIELQSDIQQRAQAGKQLDTDPDLPMVQNWERLGIKEAIKHAVARGNRYLAIPPSDETAEAVGARMKFSGTTGKYKITKESDEIYSVEPVGRYDIEAAVEELYENVSLDGSDTLSTFVNPEIIEDEDLLLEFGLAYRGDIFGEGDELNIGNLDSAVDSFILEIQNRARGLDSDSNYLEFKNDFDEAMDEYPIEQQLSFDEFMFEHVLKPDVSEKLNDMLLQARELGVYDQQNAGQYSEDALRGMLKTSKEGLQKLARTGRPVEIEEGTAGGGEGIMNFYDVTIQSEKRLRELGVPIVEISQTRPDGTKTQVKTKAFDLKSLQGKNPKDIPYSLYSLAAGIVTTSGALATMDSEEPKMYNQGGFVNEEDGQQQAPIGALNEEVADDIPARLSEGEFVLPADVVRYIGLDKLMKMRQQAKAGLERMAEMGQLSNQEEATVPDNAPFKPEVPLAFAQGGSVYDPRDFNKVQNKDNTFTVKRSTSPAPTPAGGYAMKKFVNEAGSIMYIPFMGGKPMVAIPDGYKEVDRATGKVPEVPASTPDSPVVDPRTGVPVVGDPSDSGSGNGGSGDTGSDGEDPFIGDTVTKDAFEKALEEFSSEDSDIKSINEEIANAKKKTGLSAFISVLTGGGIVSAIASGAKGMMGIRKLEEKRASAIANSDKFDKFLNDNYTGKELSDALAGRQNYLRENLDEDAFQKYADDQYDGWMKIAEEQARNRALEKKKRDEEQAAREEAARVEAYKEAQRQKERAKYRDLADKIDSSGGTYTPPAGSDGSEVGYVPPSQQPTTSPGQRGGFSTISSSSSDDNSNDYSTPSYSDSDGMTTQSSDSFQMFKDGGLVKRRKRK